MRLQEKRQSDIESSNTSGSEPDAMLLFNLFRIRVPFPTGPCEQAPERDWIGDIIRSRPSADIGKGRVWHIDNVREIDETGLLFVVGLGDSCSDLDAEAIDAPCTYALYDTEYGLLSIALAPPLSSSAGSMVHDLRKLLNAHTGAHDGRRIEIDEIIDPDDFIDHIMSADVVTEFTMQFDEHDAFDGGNGIDASMREMLEVTGGKKVRTSIQGDDLDREALEGLARAAAADGHEVSIRLREAMGGRSVERRMRGDLIDFLVKRRDIPARAEAILTMARQIYSHIRGNQPG